MQKKYRLRDRSDFSRVYRYGRSFANHQLVLYVFHRPQVERFRVGVSASKKIGNAVMRNRMRRMIKEIVRREADRIIDHVDLIFIVRKGATEMNYDQLTKSVQHVMRKGSVFKQ
ncbi:ribonuclease P protein component [Paenibacillus dendritiformis]|uniref:ribonuclease P protein component n=1 Tax=Paenibacillus dendritiformis TaxID=130049 RepID=UPI00105A1851|nr:ribonuclease P protein component [Paenibacillus dendritiformis]MDU5141790.1 ribonuclease P protein component [Paenibacillus dendritiformis]NKI20298.1 ribonuclease P protein component [Paenibacillus dendritiformis]NRG00180.1 ribonuclease P protein component [Paenibacillus dendritiformis]TDL48431.1 ribonuclease P protein component [Paenibacillus dendritiformis]GIO76341.1 ribonuclease P protein component [Paenibacillus dendritiformis]